MTYLTKAPKPTAEQLAEIAKLEASAAAKLAEKAASFERCDTDGFLSQWANGINAQLDRAKIELLKNGGHAQFRVLVDAEGNVVADTIHQFTNPYSFGTDYKFVTLETPEARRLGRKWIPTGSKSRIQKQLGLHEEHRWFPAYAKISGSGTGLSGCASATVATIKTK